MGDYSDFHEWLQWLDTQHEEMIKATIELAEINSGSLNAEGVDKVRKKIETLLIPLGVETEIISVPPFQKINDYGDITSHPLGKALRVKKNTAAPVRVFLCAHMDTVFASDHHFQKTHWLDDRTLNGPGVADLKGGIIVMLKALELLEKSPLAGKIDWEILFNPDEEIGSPGSAALIEEAASRCDIGLIYEPCMPDGTLAGERKGSGNFTVISYGKSAHAGREHHLGRNAISNLCDFITKLDILNKRPGVTINCGYFHGGGAVNVVPDRAVLHFNVRINSAEDEKWCLHQFDQMLRHINQKDGLKLELTGSFGRKPKKINAANKVLLSMLQSCGETLGIPISWKASGGCCDGNNLSAAGVPNIDTLGVQGGNIHSSKEYMLTDSLVQRAKLSALLLLKIASNPSGIKQMLLDA